MTVRRLTVSGILTLLLALVPGGQGGHAIAAPLVGTAARVQADLQTVALADTLPPDSIAVLPAESAPEHADTLVAGEAFATGGLDSIALQKDLSRRVKPKFSPDPNRALWLSLVLPGAGQIYNRKYWKLPIVYGGFLGCTYAFMWNQQMYRDYSQAYLDIMDDDPRTQSYMNMLPPRYDITGREEYFKDIFKNKKNRYRRYRDLSVFCFIGVYLLSVIDAYVDAQLSEFDISPDLSMRVEPTLISSGGSGKRQAVGLGCSLSF